MSVYEAMFILRPGLSEEDQNKVVSELEKILKQNQAEITNSQVFGKRQLAYEIKKCREGLYYLIDFSSSSGTAVAKLKQACIINESVLRVLITKEKVKAVKP